MTKLILKLSGDLKIEILFLNHLKFLPFFRLVSNQIREFACTFNLNDNAKLGIESKTLIIFTQIPFQT
jgi:hypothetical protein